MEIYAIIFLLLCHTLSQSIVLGNLYPSFIPAFNSALDDSSPWNKIVSTGTTIVGLCCREGIVLGSDTRCTSGPLVVNKEKLKIASLGKLIGCACAGTSADCDQIVRKTALALTLQKIDHSLPNSFPTSNHQDAHNVDNNVVEERVSTAVHLISKLLQTVTPRGSLPSSAVIVGGWDSQGPSLYQITPDGIPYRSRYCALGSGAANAISVLESIRYRRMTNENINAKFDEVNRSFKDDLNGNLSEEFDVSKLPVVEENDVEYESKTYTENISLDEGIDAVRRAVRAGILNDLGSGSHVDICVITSSGAKQWREEMVSTWLQHKERNALTFVSLSAQSKQERNDNDTSSEINEPRQFNLTGLGRRIFRKPVLSTRVIGGIKFSEASEFRTDSDDSQVEVQFI